MVFLICEGLVEGWFVREWCEGVDVGEEVVDEEF